MVNVDHKLQYSYPGATRNTLKHYGVLGMKWGVRKEDQLTSGGRIRKGTKINRLTTNQNEENSGSTYAIAKTKFGSYPEGEKNFIADWISDDPKARLYQIDMKLKTDLILPSMTEKGKVLVDNILSDPKFVKQIIKSSDDFLGKDRQSVKGSKERKDALMKARKLPQIEIDPTKTGVEAFKNENLQKAYISFTQALNDKTIRGAYISVLSKKGYNAVSDDLMDLDMKNILYENRIGMSCLKEKRATKIGSTLGFIGSIPVTALTGNPSLGLGVNVGGAMLGYALASASNKKAFPNDRYAYGTSSVIIFDRKDSLDIIRTKPYRPKI